tara:strand:- start:2605 stop:3051 length:447 start_codon:yes stop_codon:yes gene_type:complete
MTTLGNFVVGETLKASDMNIIGTWSSFTVTTTGSANMTFVGAQCVLNKVCFFEIVGTSTGAATPPLTVTLPQTIDTQAASSGFRAGYFDDSATQWYYGPAQRASSTTVNTRVWNASATYLTGTALTNLIPFTWAISDLFVLTGSYRIA